MAGKAVDLITLAGLLITAIIQTVVLIVRMRRSR